MENGKWRICDDLRICDDSEFVMILNLWRVESGELRVYNLCGPWRRRLSRDRGGFHPFYGLCEPLRTLRTFADFAFKQTTIEQQK